MDFGRAYTFVKDDQDWLMKVAVGAVILILSILIIPIPLIVGYQVAVARNVRDGKDLPLPRWDDMGQLFMDGLYVLIANIVYTLPLWIIFCLSFGVWFLPALGLGNDDLTGALGGVAFLTWMVMCCLVVLLFIGLAFVAPAITIQYIRTGEFGTLFRFGEVLGIVRDNLVNILLIMILSFLANAVVGVLANAIPCLGTLLISLPGTVWIMIATGHLYGQIAAQSSGKMAASPGM